MRGRYYFLIFVGAAAVVWGFYYRPFPPIATIPPFVIMDIYYPNSLLAIQVWHYALPGLHVVVGGSVLFSLWHVYFEKRNRRGPGSARLPAWPLDPESDGTLNRRRGGPPPGRRPGGPPARVAHHPGAGTLHRSRHLRSRRIGENFRLHASLRLGSLLGWRASDPEKRAAALVLEVKGDFCHDIGRILTETGRGSDYVELGMNGRWHWNPAVGHLARFLLAGLYRVEPCSINSSARARTRSGNKPIPMSSAGLSSCTGCCPESG